MERRYFVTVVAGSKQALANLQTYDLDLFHATVQALLSTAAFARDAAAGQDREGFQIDGLLPLADVARLVDDGYQVVVKAAANQKTPAQTEIIAFEQWLKDMEE